MNKTIKLIAICIAIGTLLLCGWELLYAGVAGNRTLILFEPILPLRIIEVVLMFLAIPVLIKILWDLE